MTEVETVPNGAGGAAVEQAVEAAEHAAEAAGHAEGSGGIGDHIIHHVLDSPEIEIPFTDLAIPLPELHLFGFDLSITKHVVMMWVTGAILLLVLVHAARRIREPVPSGVRNFLEVFVVFIRDEIARKLIPGHADRYVPYLLSTFFFIWTCNLLGLIPGMASATGDISVTAGLALMAFVQIQWGGIRQYGVVGHFKHLVPGGIPLWLVPLMVFVEFLSMLIKPFALCIRLFANMMAGHVVALAFISLIFIMGEEISPVAAWASAPVSVALTLFIYVLELLIKLIQAYIFTVLTATFIGMSIHPAH